MPWVQVRRKHVDVLGEIATGRRTPLGRSLRKQLEKPRAERPEKSHSWQLRSGDFVAVETDQATIDALLEGDADGEAARTLYHKAARAWGVHDQDPATLLAAAPVRTRRFDAKRVRSVVSGGLPESRRRRH